jgi:hypothetical protein
MKQADLGLNLTSKRTRKREFLAEMERVVPWASLVALITPYTPEGRRGLTLPRFHVQQEVENFRGTENRNERGQVQLPESDGCCPEIDSHL